MPSDSTRLIERPANLDIALLLARLMLAAIFPVAAWYKILAPDRTAGYFGSLGLPLPGLMVWLVIAVEIGLPLLLVLGIRTRWVAAALLLYTIATALIGHRFWAFDAATQYPQYFNNLTHFLKNIGMAGGFAPLAMLGPGRYAVEPGR